MTSENTPPIVVTDLLYKIDNQLISLLKSLTPDEWNSQTVAKLWNVKDVSAHLLDGNIRIVSALRDSYSSEKPEIHSYDDLLTYLNGLNADWVKAMKRVSPQMIIFLHEATGKLFCDYYASLNPFDKAVYSVAWAGQSESLNWMHMAREYTEKFLHQQQIREAVNKPGIMTREYFYPFIDTLMFGLSYTYRDIHAEERTVIKLSISGDIGGEWFLLRQHGEWLLTKENKSEVSSEVIIDPNDGWKLFSKSIRPNDIMNNVIIKGNRQLGEIALSMVSVMA